MQDRGFNSFASNMIKLSVNETKWSSLLAWTRAFVLYISIWIFDFGPEKLPGLSRNGPQARYGGEIKRVNNRFRAKKGATAITTLLRGVDSNSGSDAVYERWVCSWFSPFSERSLFSETKNFWNSVTRAGKKIWKTWRNCWVTGFT